MNPGVNTVSNDGAEFAPSGVDDLSVDFRAVIAAIMAQVTRDRACSEIHLIP